MKKLLKSRTSILILGIAALLALVYLAAALGNITFAPAQSFQTGQTVESSGGGRSLPDIPLWQQILFWLLILVLLITVLAVLAPRERKKLAKQLGNMTIILLVIAYLGLKYGSEVLQPTPEPTPAEVFEAMSLPSGETVTAQPQELPPPTLPPTLSFVVTLVFALGVMILAWWLVRRGQAQRPPPPLSEIAGIARSALNDLSAGKEWGNTIIACYVRMSQSVGERRGFTRKRGATPSEFAEELERAGLPGYTTRRLTQLFERVRYGAKQAGKDDIQEAIACLTDILHACGEAL
jgi:hypothetical protein